MHVSPRSGAYPSAADSLGPMSLEHSKPAVCLKWLRRSRRRGYLDLYPPNVNVPFETVGSQR